MSKAAAGGAAALGGGLLGALGSKGPSSQTVSTQTQLPPWLNYSGQANLQQAFSVAQNLLGPYSGPRVAGMTPGMTANLATLEGNVGSTNPAFGVAQSIAANVGGYQPGQVTPGLLATTDLSPYMSPFTSNVINSSLDVMDQQRQKALNQIGDAARAVGAFGGSRQGVAEGVTNAQYGLLGGQLASQLADENFTQARQAAGQDIANNLGAQEANQSAGLTGAGLNLSAAGSLGSLAEGGQNAFLQGLMGAIQGQGIAQNQQQQEIDAARGAYGEAQQFPVQQLQIVEQALGMTPYGTNTTQSSSLPGGNPFLGALGGAATGVGLLGSFGGFGMPTNAGGNNLTAYASAQDGFPWQR